MSVDVRSRSEAYRRFVAATTARLACVDGFANGEAPLEVDIKHAWDLAEHLAEEGWSRGYLNRRGYENGLENGRLFRAEIEAFAHKIDAFSFAPELRSILEAWQL